MDGDASVTEAPAALERPVAEGRRLRWAAMASFVLVRAMALVWALAVLLPIFAERLIVAYWQDAGRRPPAIVDAIGAAAAWLGGRGRIYQQTPGLYSIAGPLLLLTAAAIWWRVRAARRWRRFQDGQCVACGYTLRGAAGPDCPECGRAFRFADDATAKAAATAAAAARRRVLIGLAICLAIILLTSGVALVRSGWFSVPEPSVDYAAVLRSKLPTAPVDEQAWPLYREILQTHGELIDGRRKIKLNPLYVLEGGTRRGVQPEDAEWQTAAAFLRERVRLLSGIREAAALPTLGFQVGFAHELSADDRAALFGAAWEPEKPSGDQLAAGYLGHVVLPHLGVLRSMAKIIQADLRLAAVEGDASRVLANLESLRGIARHCSESMVLISQLTSFAIDLLLYKELGQTIAQRVTEWDDAQLAALATALPPGNHPPIDLTAERYFVYDALQRVYDTEGHLTRAGLHAIGEMIGKGEDWSPPLSFWRARDEIADYTTIKAEYDRVMALLEVDIARPLWVQLRDPGAAAGQMDAWRFSLRWFFRFWPLSVLSHSYASAARFPGQLTAAQDALRTAIALERYYRRHGRYPQTLDALVPEFLPAVPLDQSTGLPLLYRVGEAGPLLYGRGLDDDDDRGVTADAESSALRVPEEGDWVLFPPQ